METINNRGICLLNATMQEAQVKNQELRLLYFLEWEHKHPIAYGILNAALEDSVIF